MKDAGNMSLIGKLASRIFDLIPENKEILTMDDAFDMFEVQGFNCTDLSPTLAQAEAALALAKEMYRRAVEK